MPTAPLDLRLAALRRFAVAISLLNLLGHTLLGFEQSWMQPLAALATAYSVEILLELIDARATRRQTVIVPDVRCLVDFLLPAHITGLAVAMLLYTNDRVLPTVFATAVGVASKWVFRAPTGTGTRHFLNPSNAGITVVLLLFPWVGIAPPYQFTENLAGLGDWILPGIVVASGSFLNARLTGKMPLILGWLGGFVLQAALRSWLFDVPIAPGLAPMSGLAFVLFTFYMVTDPGTTPSAPWAQVLFGGAVAAMYALLMTIHVVFGLFFGLTVVCVVRGLGLYGLAYVAAHARQLARVPNAQPVAARTV
jgi:enediyne biosynthesis protein E5